MSRRLFQNFILVLAGLFAFGWSVFRAYTQAIIEDEADTYFWFVSRSAGYLWYPFPNNHVLNSLLIWLATHVFGNSVLAVRAPALLGALIYISICYFLCKNIADRFPLQLALFICLTYNPLILDFMATARGYSLANAFLLSALAVPLWSSLRNGSSLPKCCVFASVALGLSFAANFSFGFVNLMAFLAILAWAIRRRETESIVRIASLCILPGMFLVLLVCGYPLAHWKRDDLWWGVHSMREMTRGMVRASLYQLNPALSGFKWYNALNRLKNLLLPALGILCFLRVMTTTIDGSWARDSRSRWLGRFGMALTAVVALTVTLHWLAFHFDHLPLPVGRTGIFLLPLITMIAGIVAAAPSCSVVSEWLRRCLGVAFVCLACYFLLCLRHTHFMEYESGADIDKVYRILARLNHNYGVTDVGISGFYASPLNFYRVLSKKESFPELTAAAHPPPPGKQVYVLQMPYEREFVERENLVVIYQGESTEVVVAVKPGGPVPTARLDLEELIRRRNSGRR